MWLQFAQAIASKRKYRPCKECSGWFEVSTDDTGKRINREFCSDPCKSKNYRRRKAEAWARNSRHEHRSHRKKLAPIPKPSRLGHPRERVEHHGALSVDAEKAGLHSARIGNFGSAPYLRIRRVRETEAPKVYGQTKQEAQGKLAIQNKVDSRSLTDSTKLTVGEYLTRWLKNTARNKVRATTLERYDALIRNHLIPTIGKVKLANIGWMDIEDCYSAMERNGGRRGLARWLVRYSATPSVPL